MYLTPLPTLEHPILRACPAQHGFSTIDDVRLTPPWIPSHTVRNSRMILLLGRWAASVVITTAGYM